MLDATPPSSGQPMGPSGPGRSGVSGSSFRSGAVGRIITDSEIASRTLDRPRESGAAWSTPDTIEARDAAEARAARSEARRVLFAIAGELDRAERTLADARTSGDASAIAAAEREVAAQAARLSERAQRANELAPAGRETITPERVFALLAWKRAPGSMDAGNG